MPARLAGPARAATIAALLAVLASVLALPFLGPVGARASGPLPACRYDDLLTSPRGYSDWPVTLVDTILRVPRTYTPPDLVPVSRAGIPGKGIVRDLVLDDLRAMNEAAVAADAAIRVVSAYRSYDRQQEVFASWVADLGRARALQVSARPGHSEHQLGLSLDFGSHPGGTPFEGDWDTTPAGKWMKAHAWEYGFVMSYPKGKLAVVCYDFEPWHFRYVGRELAGAIHASGLTPREYLWANFTTTIVPGSASPSTPPHPSPSADPSANPSEDPFASPSPIAQPSASVPPESTPTSSVAPQDPTAEPTPVPNDPPPVVGPDTGPGIAVVASLAVALGGVVLLAGWKVLRRGRSRLGL